MDSVLLLIILSGGLLAWNVILHTRINYLNELLLIHFELHMDQDESWGKHRYEKDIKKK